MRRFILSFISLLTVGLLSAQTNGYNPDSPDEPYLRGYYHRLFLNVTPSGGGYFSVSSAITMVEGDSMYIYAYPSSGYRFVAWKKHGTIISAVNRILYKMGTSNDTLTAEFVYDPTAPEEPFIEGIKHRVQLIASPENAGSFNFSYYDSYSYAEIVEGDSQLIRAYPNNGYRFVSWQRNGSVISTSNPYNYVMGTSNDVLTAEFIYDPTVPADPFANGYKHFLTLVSSPANAGTFNTYYYDDNRIEIVEGDSQYVYAYPRNGFKFASWKRNGIIVSTENPYFYGMGTYNDTLTAEFVYDPDSPENPGHDYLYEYYGYICSGDTVHWHGLICTTTGEYYDSLISVYGSDSIYKLTLVVFPSFFEQTTQSIPSGSSYSWRGKTLTSEGVYYDSLYTMYGCDSIYKLTLRYANAYYFEEKASICQGETYSWHGHSYNTAGIYYDSLKSVDGLDSVYKLTLTVNPIITKNLTIDVCANEQLPTWAAGFAPGRYYHIDTMTASTGCDSIINTTLNINRTYFYSQSVRMSSADVPYSWHGRSLSVSGTYYDSLLTTKGCDSVYQLNITFIDPYLFSDTVSICQGENYLWRGRRYSATGIYYDSLKTADNIDSVYRLMLTVNPVVITPVNLTACANDEMPSWAADAVAGNTYHHYDTLVASTGCDSIIHTALKVNPTYFNQQSVTWPSAAGNYNWHGKTITSSGIYYDSLTTVITGCDSVFQLNITFADKYLFEESHAICQGDYYDWRGQRYTQSGVYYDSLKAADQVDSIYKLTLTVNQNYFFPEVHTICQGETYRWHDMDCTTAGVYYDSLLTTAGCDSVYELTLTVNPTYYVQERHAICQGDVYQWHNRNLNAAGVYYDSLTTATGCDSVYELTLRVNRTYFVQEQYSICQGDVYQWHNRSLNTAGTYYDSLVTVTGCDSVYELTLTVNASYFIQEQYSICEGDYYQWHYRNLNTDGVYYDSLFTTEGCDSVYELTLTVNPTYLVEDSAELAEDGSGYMWHGKTYSVAGDYVDSLSTVFGCDSICILHLANPIHSGVEETSRIIDVKVVPNPVKAGGTAYISADWTDEEIDGMTIEVITATGAVVSRITPETQTTAIGGIGLQGLYFIRITTGTDDVYVRKLIVQ